LVGSANDATRDVLARAFSSSSSKSTRKSVRVRLTLHRCVLRSSYYDFLSGFLNSQVEREI
jgi:hypothetical protein